MTFLALMMLAPRFRCRPTRIPAGGSSHRGAMMKAMVEACANKSAGDSCSYPGRDGQTEKGTCKATRRGKLICRHPRKTGGPTGSEMPPGANPER